jgi:hypothetical protein
MRSIKTFIVVTIIAILTLSAEAQAPGYLGKHFIVNYDIYTFPALRNPNQNGNKGILAYNTRHVISVDWVTGVSQSVGLSFHLTKSTFKFKRGLNFTYKYNRYGYDDTYTETIYYNDAKGQLSAYAIGLHTNLYFNQFIAPLGTYFKPEILLIRFNVTYDDNLARQDLANHTTNAGYTMLTYPILPNKNPYTTVAIGATLGTHYIFFNRLIFDVGLQLGWVVGGKKMSEWMDNEVINSKKVNEDNYISVSAKSRLMSQYLINMNAGLGILIF